MKLIKTALLTIIFLGFAQAEYILAEDFFFKTENQYQKVLIARVISADTIVLENGEKIRLIGLKAPEPPRTEKYEERDKYGFIIERDNPLTPVEERAFEFAKHLLEGKFARLEFDSNKKADNFTTYAYVFLKDDDIFANEEIVRQGFAALHIHPENRKYEDVLREAYREARREKRGLSGE